MAYGSVVNSLNNYSGELDELYSSLSSLDFTSCWEGSAQVKQKSNFDDILTAISQQKSNCSNLANALSLIDDYDETIEIIDGYTYQINRLDTSSKDYSSNYNYLNNLRKSVITTKDNLKIQIDNALSKITSIYSSTLTTITPASVVSTVDIFKDTIGLSETMNKSLDMPSIVKSVATNSSGETIIGAGDFELMPNFSETAAWVEENPYAWSGYTGQCTWFAWGRFYEIYGYDPGFRGNGYSCANELLNAHSDKFYRSDTPVAGAVFSTDSSQRNHVGIILAVDGDTVTYQDGNYDGKNNSFAVAQKDWGTQTCSLAEFKARMGSKVYFANPR